MSPLSGTILVAESANEPSLVWHGGASEWLKESLQRGAFRGRARNKQRLELIGCQWDMSANLALPGDWDVGYADQVAALIRDMTWRRIICCGTRVAKCFGLRRVEPWGSLLDDRFIIVPHPSGRNRWWNDGDVMETRRLVCEALS